MYQEYLLPNNTRVILVPQHDTKSLTTLVMYPVGSRYESEKMSGVSHYIEHLMFKGTEKRKTTQILTREIDRLGASYNAFTGKEYTGYYIKADGAYQETAFDILSDMLYHSLFDAKEMEREKTVICEEIKMYHDNPLMAIGDQFERVFFDGVLARDIAGTERHVLSYKRDDVLAYRERYYRPSNTTIVVAGAVNDTTKDLLLSYFGSKKSRGTAPQHYAPAKLGATTKKARVHIDRREVDQVQVMLGFPAYAIGDTRQNAVTVMNTILGGSMSSRLFIQVRERRGLAYMVRSGADSYRDTGYVYVRMGLDPSKVQGALRVVTQEIEKMAQKGVTARELADAKMHIRGSQTLAMEDSSAQADWFAREALFYPKMRTSEEWLDMIDTVTNEQIQRVSRDIFRLPQMRVAIIGKVDDKAVAGV